MPRTTTKIDAISTEMDANPLLKASAAARYFLVLQYKYTAL